MGRPFSMASVICGRMDSHEESAAVLDFFQRVYEIVAQIPAGKVVSYGQIARALGAPQAARQVGWAMRHCPDALPWQRVVRQDGSIVGGEYAPLRRAMLESEGVAFLPDGRVDMRHFTWAEI